MTDFRTVFIQKFGEPFSFMKLDATAFQKTTVEFKNAFILYALQRADWNQSKAARLSGIHRNTIRKWVKLHDLENT